MSELSKQNYSAIAGILKSAIERYPDMDQREPLIDVTVALTNYFEANNPRFDTDRFLKAAGL